MDRRDHFEGDQGEAECVSQQASIRERFSFPDQRCEEKLFLRFVPIINVHAQMVAGDRQAEFKCVIEVHEWRHVEIFLSPRAKTLSIEFILS